MRRGGTLSVRHVTLFMIPGLLPFSQGGALTIGILNCELFRDECAAQPEYRYNTSLHTLYFCRVTVAPCTQKC